MIALQAALNAAIAAANAKEEEEEEDVRGGDVSGAEGDDSLVDEDGADGADSGKGEEEGSLQAIQELQAEVERYKALVGVQLPAKMTAEEAVEHVALKKDGTFVYTGPAPAGLVAKAAKKSAGVAPGTYAKKATAAQETKAQPSVFGDNQIRASSRR